MVENRPLRFFFGSCCCVWLSTLPCNAVLLGNLESKRFGGSTNWGFKGAFLEGLVPAHLLPMTTISSLQLLPSDTYSSTELESPWRTYLFRKNSSVRSNHSFPVSKQGVEHEVCMLTPHLGDLFVTLLARVAGRGGELQQPKKNQLFFLAWPAASISHFCESLNSHFHVHWRQIHYPRNLCPGVMNVWLVTQ